MPLTWDDVIGLVEQGESQSVEFEKQITGDDDIARELVAFANSDGGRIVFGIDDKNRHFLGVRADEELKTLIVTIGKSRCTPPVNPQIEIVERNGRSILVLNVPEGDEKPYKTDDICYIRDGGSSRPAREEEESEIRSPWHGHGLNKRQKRVLSYIKEHGSVTNREYRNLFSISHKTAHLELTMLTEKKLLEAEGSGRSTHYVLPEKTV